MPLARQEVGRRRDQDPTFLAVMRWRVPYIVIAIRCNALTFRYVEVLPEVVGRVTRHRFTVP